MKNFSYFGIFISVACYIIILYSLISWGVNLPKTAYLWSGGTFCGWFHLIFICIVSGCPSFCGIVIFLDELEMQKEFEKRHINISK